MEEPFLPKEDKTKYTYSNWYIMFSFVNTLSYGVVQYSLSKTSNTQGYAFLL